ncbi:MAG: EamA family transporter [Geobacteraceae bacterium]|nr:EamA family transporter [Geobacteraceae bacterium]
MTNLAFSLIVFSSVMHALWNLLVKRSYHKTVFIWWMFVSSGLMFSLLLLFLNQPIPVPDRQVLLMALGGGSCFALYHLLTGRSYSSGDISLTYPLCQTSMLYVPLWGMIIMGERFTFYGGSGIFLVALGAYSVQLQKFTLDELLRPFRNLGDSSVRFALAAGFVYSFGVMFDKAGVMQYSPLHFTWLMVFFMFTLMSINIMRSRYNGRIIEEWRTNWKLILISGPILMASFIAFRYALKMAPVGYAVPARQVSILFGVLLGMIFLKESFGRIRLASAIVILIGAFLIKMG